MSSASLQSTAAGGRCSSVRAAASGDDGSRAGLGIRTLLGTRVGVLTGGPGVGKTTVTRALLQALAHEASTESADAPPILLAAPTDRAAWRLSEATGAPAQTLHQLLEFKGADGFQRNASHPPIARGVSSMRRPCSTSP